MMGIGHALTGAATWVALTAPNPVGLGLIPTKPAEVAVGALITAGAALLPDTDHPNGTIAHSLPPLTTVLTRATERLSGGHRHATHSLFGVAVFVSAAWAATLGQFTFEGHRVKAGVGIFVAVLVAFALRAVRATRGRWSAWVFALVGGVSAAMWGPGGNWLPYLVGVGAVVHLAGDALTTGGVPLLWPWRPKPATPTPFWSAGGFFSLPILGPVTSIRAQMVTVAAGLYTAVGVVWPIWRTYRG